jgi:hypothetical protein
MAMVSVSPQSTAIAFQQVTTPDVPSPAECTVEPRAIPSPPATSEPTVTPRPTPTIPTGQPANEETVQEISAVVRGSVACSNAGDILRSLSYFSDEYVVQMFTGPDGVDYEGFLQYLSTPAAALQVDQQLAIIEISDVQTLENGMVSARVVTGDPANPFDDILFFSEQNDRWLIAASIPITTIEATPTP